LRENSQIEASTILIWFGQRADLVAATAVLKIIQRRMSRRVVSGLAGFRRY
jgi:hypothetical protein